jgi:hypothetical protein
MPKIVNKSWVTEETYKMIKSQKLITKTVKLLETDTIAEIAVKIYVHFQYGQSCTVRGTRLCHCVQNPEITREIPTGEFVVQLLCNIMKEEHSRTNIDDIRRHRGRHMEIGYKESKAFRYFQEPETGYVNIWRVK